MSVHVKNVLKNKTVLLILFFKLLVSHFLFNSYVVFRCIDLLIFLNSVLLGMAPFFSNMKNTFVAKVLYMFVIFFLYKIFKVEFVKQRVYIFLGFQNTHYINALSKVVTNLIINIKEKS